VSGAGLPKTKISAAKWAYVPQERLLFKIQMLDAMYSYRNKETSRDEAQHSDLLNKAKV